MSYMTAIENQDTRLSLLMGRTLPEPSANLSSYLMNLGILRCM